MYLRFRGVSLRYFARVSLNSTVLRMKVYMIRAEMWGGYESGDSARCVL